MSSEALPVVAKTNLPGKPSKATKADVLRLQDYRRRLQTGTESLRAFAETMTDPTIGYSEYRGKPSVPVSVVRRALASMLRRCAGEELQRATDDVVQRIAGHAPAAADTLGRIANGDFADADRARAQTGAAKIVLEVAGLGRGQPQAAAAPTEPMFSDGKGGFISVRALGERMRQRANSYSADAPIQVQAEVRSVPDIGTHNPRGAS